MMMLDHIVGVKVDHGGVRHRDFVLNTERTGSRLFPLFPISARLLCDPGRGKYNHRTYLPVACCYSESIGPAQLVPFRG